MHRLALVSPLLEIGLSVVALCLRILALVSLMDGIRHPVFGFHLQVPGERHPARDPCLRVIRHFHQAKDSSILTISSRFDDDIRHLVHGLAHSLVINHQVLRQIIHNGSVETLHVLPIMVGSHEHLMVILLMDPVYLRHSIDPDLSQCLRLNADDIHVGYVERLVVIVAFTHNLIVICQGSFKTYRVSHQ